MKLRGDSCWQIDSFLGLISTLSLFFVRGGGLQESKGFEECR